MRIDQLVPSLAKFDAIGNHVLQVRRVLRDAGFQSDIFAESTDPRLAREAHPYLECSTAPDPHRVLLYHAATRSPIAAWLQDRAQDGQVLACDYHNVTPSRYFARWEPLLARSLDLARDELAGLAPWTGLAMADSGYNRAELTEVGYRNTAVCPLLVDLDEYHRPPDARTLGHLRRQKDAGGNDWLFVGRIAPNKCQHDVIAAFALYRRLFDPQGRLTLVGGATSFRYLRALHQLIGELELGDSVVLRDVLPFPQLLAHFRVADVFMCQSEHEGFCVPILEAMELGVPVIAYSAAALTDTVGGAGILLDDKDPLAVACVADALLTDDNRRAALVAAGRQRAASLSLPASSHRFLQTINGWLSTLSSA